MIARAIMLIMVLGAIFEQSSRMSLNASPGARCPAISMSLCENPAVAARMQRGSGPRVYCRGLND